LVANDHSFGSAVARDHARFTAHGIIDGRRQSGFGLAQLELSRFHDMVTTVVTSPAQDDHT
jgi:hypothetical protein